MAIDPGLANDSCIFIEAVSGDGGTHNANSIWWLSHDINLVGPVSGPDSADAGQINPVVVSFHRKPASSNCVFPGDESLTVELWVANPSLVISPRVHLGAKRVGFIGALLPAEGDSGTQQIDWDVPANASPGDPQSAGHKCLVARAYPSSGAPATNNFFLPGDQHVAQHNLCIVRATTNVLTFTANTANPQAPHPPTINPTPNAKLRAVQDVRPNTFVRNTITSRLASLAGFQQLRTKTLPGGFKFDLTNLHASGIVDHSHPTIISPFPPHILPSFEAKVFLDPRHVTPITFLADLTGVARGEACIFHLIQTSLTDVVEGGLTLVALKD
ncbi:MAG TPA: hypothetical protein VIF81_02655 [Pyrinomonadaceae bacterium]